jgi:hypothetical protein
MNKQISNQNKKRKKMQWVFALALSISVTSCMVPVQVKELNSMNSSSSGNKKFGVKSVDSSSGSITYTGDWSTVTDSTAVGGSYKSGSGSTSVESDSGSLFYVGSWGTTTDASASGGSYKTIAGPEVLLSDDQGGSFVYGNGDVAWTASSTSPSITRTANGSSSTPASGTPRQINNKFTSTYNLKYIYNTRMANKNLLKILA